MELARKVSGIIREMLENFVAEFEGRVRKASYKVTSLEQRVK